MNVCSAEGRWAYEQKDGVEAELRWSRRGWGMLMLLSYQRWSLTTDSICSLPLCFRSLHWYHSSPARNWAEVKSPVSLCFVFTNEVPNILASNIMMYVLLFGRAKECQAYYTFFFVFLHYTEIMIRYKLWLTENGLMDARRNPLWKPLNSHCPCVWWNGVNLRGQSQREAVEVSPTV